MGIAPQAELVVQSIWQPTARKLIPPADLTTLFDEAYQIQATRVHSNPWGTSNPTHDFRGNPIPFQQKFHTTAAEEIDKFVYEHPEMVICFAAGNDGERPLIHLSRGHIGAQAAAKNCITVGASRSSRDPHDSNPDAVANLSSRGPIYNGRCKPDVVAPGKRMRHKKKI